jgi:hypothetical protein
MLALHFLPGYAPELNPDEREAYAARSPARQGKKAVAFWVDPGASTQ